MSLVSVNQLPRAWPLPSDWMQLSPWTDTTEVKKTKQNNNKNTKAEGQILDPPWEPRETWGISISVSHRDSPRFLLDSSTLYWLLV